MVEADVVKKYSQDYFNNVKSNVKTKMRLKAQKTVVEINGDSDSMDIGDYSI